MYLLINFDVQLMGILESRTLDFKNLITSYFCDEKKLMTAGKAAAEIVIAHSGASKKIADQIFIK